MSISCQQLYRDVLGTVGVGTGSELTLSRFTTAVNRTLAELGITADLETKHTPITGPESTITTLDSQYEWMLAAGVSFYMTRLGQRPSDPNIAQLVYRDTANEWERAKGEYVANRWNELQANGDEDIIALGYVG